MEGIQSIENSFFPITLEMNTPSQAITLTIDQIVRVNDILYVLSSLHRPEVGDCAIGHVKAETSYTIQDGATDLKVKHFVLGHNWNWGKSDDIAYLESAKDFEKVLSECRYPLTQKAQEFSNGDEELFTYIMKILESAQFQTGPQGYLSDWKERRGCTEEWRVLEDGARLFFDREFPTPCR